MVHNMRDFQRNAACGMTNGLFSLWFSTVTILLLLLRADQALSHPLETVGLQILDIDDICNFLLNILKQWLLLLQQFQGTA